MTYQEKKELERKEMQEFIDAIYADDDPEILYKESHVITDLRDMMYQCIERYGADHVAFKQRFVKGEPFREITYGQTVEEMNALGTFMTANGLKDKRVAVIGENCYQWAISYLAVINGVGVVVPLDRELGAKELEGLIKEAEVEAVVFTKKYLNMFREIKDKGETSLRMLINMNAEDDEEGVYSFFKAIEKGKELVGGGNRTYLDAEIDNEELAVLLFTSGTTGIAKGVMHNHKALCINLISSPMLLRTTSDVTFFSILPIHHTYECTATFLEGMYKGSCIAFCEGLKYIQKNLKEIQPDFFLGVPLIFESLYRTIWKNIRKQGKEESVKRIMKLNKLTSKVGIDLNKKFLKDIIDVFGGKLRIIISGGAAIEPEILDFFRALGITAVQGYGLTECAPMVALNGDRFPRSDACGHVLPGTEVKIVDEENGVGEICVKGPHVMMGYYNMPEETAKVLQDGWFHTGDIGYIDDTKHIYITGRKKNVIITRNGKNVFPEELEHYLSKIPFVEESMVWAASDEDGQDDIITATIKPDMEQVREALGDDAENSEKLAALLKAEVDKINDELPVFKQIRKVVVRMEDFEKTTGHKIKRFVASNRNS